MRRGCAACEAVADALRESRIVAVEVVAAGRANDFGAAASELGADRVVLVGAEEALTRA